MSRFIFRLSSLANPFANRARWTQMRELSRRKLLSAVSLCGLLGCSSEPEQPAAAPAAGGQPAAQNAAPGAMPGTQPAGMQGMQPGGMPPGGMPGGAAMPPGGAGMNPQQMAQMQNSGGSTAPMPPNSGSGANMTPEQMAQMQKAGAGATPMPQNSGAGANMTPEQMAQMQRAGNGAGANPNPQNPGAAAAGRTPEQMAQMQQAGAGANPVPGGAGAPNAAAGAGFAGAPGGGGPGSGGGPGGGVPRNPSAQVGTPEYSAEKVVLQLLSGDLSGLEEFISPNCKGLLGDVRDGKATDQQKEELKKLFVGLQAAGKPRTESGAKVLAVRNADGAMITFKVKKEGESQKVTEMTVKKGTTKKR